MLLGAEGTAEEAAARGGATRARPGRDPPLRMEMESRG